MSRKSAAGRQLAAAQTLSGQTLSGIDVSELWRIVVT